MRLDVRHLLLIRAIAEESSVTRAGIRLHLSQPALSRQLQDAEERLGMPLFYRRKRRMVLTPAGEELLEAARVVLDQLERVETRLLGSASGEEGVLRIASECHTCYRWLPALFALFRQRHPRVHIRVLTAAASQPFEALLDGTIDLAIASSKAGDAELEPVRLFDDELVVVMSPRHPAARRARFLAEDFRSEHLLVYNMPIERNRVARELLIPAGIAPDGVTQVQLTEGIVEMIKAGLGISLLARWAVARELESGELVAVSVGPKPLVRQWSAVRRRSETTPGYIRDFIRLLADNPPVTRLDA